MPAFGDGERLLVTGSTHDARGYRRTSEADAQAMLVEHLTRKVLDHRDAYARVERLLMGDDEELDVLFISFGFSARSAYRAAQTLRTEGCRAGLLRLCTLWPFDDQAVRAATAKARRILVPEMNRGQALREVQRLAPGARGCNRTDGEVITPDDIVAAVRDWYEQPNGHQRLHQAHGAHESFPTPFCPGCGHGILMCAILPRHRPPRLEHGRHPVRVGHWLWRVDSQPPLCRRCAARHPRATHRLCHRRQARQPDLKVVVIGGDGDIASIGGNT